MATRPGQGGALPPRLRGDKTAFDEELKGLREFRYATRTYARCLIELGQRLETLLKNDNELTAEASHYAANEAMKRMSEADLERLDEGDTEALTAAAERTSKRLGQALPYLAILRLIADERDRLDFITRLLVESAHAEFDASGMALSIAAKISSDTASRWLREPILQTGEEWAATRTKEEGHDARRSHDQ